MVRRLVVVLLVVVMAAGVRAETAQAHSGEWAWTHMCTWGLCVVVPIWRTHDHSEESREEREARCYENYEYEIQFCQIRHPGNDRGASGKRRACYAEAADTLARCMRGR